MLEKSTWKLCFVVVEEEISFHEVTFHEVIENLFSLSVIGPANKPPVSHTHTHTCVWAIYP